MTVEYAGLALLVQVILGWMWQWARGPKKIPNWVSWAVFGVIAVACYIWATPDVFTKFHTDWRITLFLMASFVLSARGAAGTSSDVKAAPKTNTLQ